ncbi:hypothetical protein [Salinisphaera aquimarina]|uniref:Pentapeptide MXKDX repeat protein n=1 Tax=Salinisphaera aquimarina TaxID=2094031 RepID=A0ABV7ESH7_9GAMM
MRKTLKHLTAATLVAASFAASPALFAATQGDKTTNSGSMGQMMQGHDKGQMMQGHNSMGQGKGMMNNGQMPMMQMMTQMNDMMANCNDMMQTKMEKSGSDKGSAEKS